MFEILKRFKDTMIKILAIMLTIVLLLAVVELGYTIALDIVTPPVFLLDIGELLELFGLFMLVVIGIELLDTIMKTYTHEAVDHVKVVMAVAIIAISRKVIILDIQKLPPLTLIGIGIIILAITFGYFLIKRQGHDENK
ncbi:MAG: phosphate-starvation-inducible PsiE family protein [candidate division WOR-3 bacterium]